MVPILPVAYFGNIEYFWMLAKYAKVKIDLGETYQKQTYRNRAEIYGANGILTLSVPVTKPFGKKTKTNDVLISYAENWQKNHWRSIESAYRRTPFYEFYADDIQQILFKPHQTLVQLTNELTLHISNKIGIDCNISFELDSPTLTENDFRLQLSPKLKSDFKSKPYIQTFSDRNPFINNLSILDVLFNEGPNTICILEESKN
jgi:hypothetical protein